MKLIPMFAEYLVIDTLQHKTKINKDLISLDYTKVISGAYISKNKNIDLLKPSLKKLKKQIHEHLKKLIYEVFYFNTEFTITNFWSTKTPKGYFGQPHIHTNSWLSGIYYPETVESSSIRFYKKQTSLWDIKTPCKFNFANADFFDVSTVENTLLLFSSDTKHSIHCNIMIKIDFLLLLIFYQKVL